MAQVEWSYTRSNIVDFSINFTDPVFNARKDVGLEPRQENCPYSQAFPRRSEHGRRSGVMEGTRQLRVEIRPMIFQRIIQILGPCQVDLFASRISAQIPKYMSWKPDPGAIATDTLNQPRFLHLY